nr:uncharacterized protein LOC109758928 [Aegilops tauschii subsp. strangulata]
MNMANANTPWLLLRKREQRTRSFWRRKGGRRRRGRGRLRRGRLGFWRRRATRTTWLTGPYTSSSRPCARRTVRPLHRCQSLLRRTRITPDKHRRLPLARARTPILLRLPLPRARTPILHLRVDDLLQITEAWVDGVLVFSFCFDFVKLATYDETV